jgi:hypothetical protein
MTLLSCGNVADFETRNLLSLTKDAPSTIPVGQCFFTLHIVFVFDVRIESFFRPFISFIHFK